MVRSIPSPSALYAGTEKHEDHTEVASLAKQMYLKRIHDERYGEENYYHPHQPRIVSASEDLVKDAAPFPFRNPVQDPRNDKEQVPTGQLAIRFRFRKWGCGSPAESWGFEARHLMPPEIESRMCREDWVAAIDEINNGYVKYPWPKLVWIPLVFGATVGAILEGSLRTIRYLPDGVVFSIFTAAGGARFLPPPPLASLAAVGSAIAATLCKHSLSILGAISVSCSGARPSPFPPISRHRGRDGAGLC